MNNKELVRFTNVLDEIIEILNRVILNQYNGEEPYNFFFSIFFKTTHTIKAVNHLLKDIENNHFFLISCGLSIRTVISDLIISEYLIFKSEHEIDSNTRLVESIELQYYDHYKFRKKRIMDVYDSLYGNAPEYLRKKKDFEEYGKRYLDSDGKIKSHLTKDNPSVFGMIRFLKDKYRGEAKKKLTIAFEMYDIFSILEHFGEKTMELISGSASSNKSELSIGTIVCGIKVSLFYLKVLLPAISVSKESADYGELFRLFDEINNLKVVE